MYIHINPDECEMRIEATVINIQMNSRFARVLETAILKALQMERKDIANHLYSPETKKVLIELKERLNKANTIPIYTTTEQERLEQSVKTSYSGFAI